MTSSAVASNKAFLSRNFILVTLMMLLTGMCGEMLTPTMPQFSIEMGSDQSMMGMAGTVLGVAAMLFRPFAGALADSIGRRKVAVLGTALYIISFISYLFITSFMQLLVIRVIQGIATCTASTALSTIITDVVPKENVTEGLALANVAGAITMSAGPAIGLWIMNIFSMRGVFIFAVAMLTLAIVLFFPMNYVDPVAAKEKSPSEPAGTKARIIEQSAVLPMLMLFLLITCQTAAFVYLPQFAAQCGVNDVGIFFLVLSVGVIYTRMFIGKIITRFQERAIVLFGSLTFCLCIGIFAVNISMPTLIFSGLIFGFGYGAMTSVLNGLALRSCTPKTRGVANATFMMGYDFGFAAGSFMWGVVIKLVGFQLTFIIAALIPLSVVPIYYISKHRSLEYNT